MNSFDEINTNHDRVKGLTRLAVSSQKGGVAKTTTSISLGGCLVELGYSVLLVDLDPQAHLTQAMGVNPEKVRHSIGDALLNQVSLLSVTRESIVPELELVPANAGLLLIDKILYKTDGYEFRLRNLFTSNQTQQYDFIIFDCPPTFGPLTLNALTSADLVIVPSTCDYFSAHSLHNYLDLFDLVRRKSNPNLDYRILITLFESRTKLSKLILDQYRNKYQEKIFEPIISIDVKLRESSLFGKPITMYAKSSKGAAEYRAVTRELLTCVKMMN